MIRLGLWALGESKGFHRGVSARDAKDRIKKAYRSGIGAFDTAFAYNADSLLYSALKEIGVRTDETDIIEKIMPVPTLRKKFDASLRALRADHTETVMIHWPANDEMLFRALRDAEKIVEEKKANRIGVSNFPVELTRRVMKDFDIRINERAYSPLWTKEIDAEPLKLALYGVFGFGTLFHREAPSDERGSLWCYRRENYPEFLELFDTISRIEEKDHVTRPEVLYAFAKKKSDEIIIGSGDSSWLGSEYELSSEDETAIREKADALTSLSKSDNIFGHDWRI